MFLNGKADTADNGRRPPRGRWWRRHSRRRARVHRSRSWLRTRTWRRSWSWKGDNGNVITGQKFRWSPGCRRRRRDPRWWAGVDWARARARTRTGRWLRSRKCDNLSFGKDAGGGCFWRGSPIASRRESSIAESPFELRGVDCIGTLSLCHARRDVRIRPHFERSPSVARSNR